MQPIQTITHPHLIFVECRTVHDRLLNEYGVILIDEAHERTVNADLLMGFLKKSASLERFRLVIMSATLDTFRFCQYFDSAPIIWIPGSLHPIEHFWLRSPTEDYVKLTIDTILSIHCSDSAVSECGAPDGHILVFLTGQQEIENVVSMVRSCDAVNWRFTLEIHPLYASLNSADRQRAFDEPFCCVSTRKCVVATNIAETSLTICNV
eukprot:458239_1